MRLKKTKDGKSAPQQSYADNDFASILEESRFDRFKPFLKGFIVLLLLVGVVGGGMYAYSNFKPSEQSGDQAASADSYEDGEQAKCIAKVYEQHETPEEGDLEFYPKLIAGYDAHLACYDKYPDENSPSTRLSIESARQEAIDASGAYKETYLSGTSSNHASSTANTQSGDSSPSTYDPSKCEPLNSEASKLKQVSDQKRVTYDNAFAVRKNYGYFYEQYGNSIDAQRAYDAQQAQLNLLQTDWNEALNKQNAAYSKYQECRASL